MHVHTKASGECKTPVIRHFSRESYSEPAEVYSLLKKRGMDLVTLTDHDSIEGGEGLQQRADFFVSEELTCTMPSGTEAHVGAYDITERQHVELQRRRDDLFALLAYLSERRIFFSINHVFSSLTGPRDAADFGWIRECFPAIEGRNGAILAFQNENSERLALQWEKIAIAGSDAHALASAGTAYTEVPGARNKDEFLAGLRAGKGRLGGESGSYSKLTRDILLVGVEMMREKRWKALLAPLAMLVPCFTLYNYLEEHLFGEYWAAQIFEKPAMRLSPRWAAARQSAAEEYV